MIQILNFEFVFFSVECFLRSIGNLIEAVAAINYYKPKTYQNFFNFSFFGLIDPDYKILVLVLSVFKPRQLFIILKSCRLFRLKKFLPRYLLTLPKFVPMLVSLSTVLAFFLFQN